MKAPNLSARDRRTIRIGAIIVLPLLAWRLGVVPFRASLADAKDRLSVEREALARERGAVATAKRNPELQHLTDSVLHAMEPRLFEGKDDVMASSELAAYVGDVANRYHVWVQDASTRPATSVTTGVRMLHIEIRAESDFQGVLNFLQALEHGDKYTRIERLDVSRVLSGPGNEKAETLSLAATISGYAMGGASTATPAASTGTAASARGTQP